MTTGGYEHLVSKVPAALARFLHAARLRTPTRYFACLPHPTPIAHSRFGSATRASRRSPLAASRGRGSAESPFFGLYSCVFIMAPMPRVRETHSEAKTPA